MHSRGTEPGSIPAKKEMNKMSMSYQEIAEKRQRDIENISEDEIVEKIKQFKSTISRREAIDCILYSRGQDDDL